MAIMRGSMKPKTVTSGGAPSRPTGKAPVKTGGRTSGFIGSVGRSVGKVAFSKPKSIPSKAPGKPTGLIGSVGKAVGKKISSRSVGTPKKTFSRIGTGLAKPGGTVRKMKSTPRKIGNKIDYKKIGSFARPSKPVTRKARPVPVKRRK